MISFGIMQGRLTPSQGKGIQFFPFDHWEKEFELGEIGRASCRERVSAVV